MVGVAVAALALTSAGNAAFITGGISFFGSYTPQDAASTTVADLALASQIAFGPTAVGFSGTSGDFTSIPDLSTVTMFTPLVFSPVTLPGVGVDLWNVSGGGDIFSFELTSFSADPVTGTAPGAQSLDLMGTGNVSYVGPKGLVTTPGSWTGTFNAGGGTFSWSSSTASVPDGGTTLALFGLSLLGLHGARRKLAKC